MWYYKAIKPRGLEREDIMEVIHAVAPDAGRNVRCACGAEYSQVANLMRHIDVKNV